MLGKRARDVGDLRQRQRCLAQEKQREGREEMNDYLRAAIWAAGILVLCFAVAALLGGGVAVPELLIFFAISSATFVVVLVRRRRRAPRAS